MHRVVGLLPSGQVTACVSAVGCSNVQVEVVIDVASLARHIRVAARERKTDGRSRMVAGGCSKPGVERGVATLTARRWKSRRIGGVRGIGSALPVFHVAGLAIRRKAVEDAAGGLLVTVLALDRGVRSKKWKAILVILHLPRGNIPSLHGVTLLAIGSHLAAVHIAMAIRTVFANVCKHGFHVAQNAFNLLVHSS
jgi:hypothetical protein